MSQLYPLSGGEALLVVEGTSGAWLERVDLYGHRRWRAALPEPPLRWTRFGKGLTVRGNRALLRLRAGEASTRLAAYSLQTGQQAWSAVLDEGPRDGAFVPGTSGDRLLYLTRQDQGEPEVHLQLRDMASGVLLADSGIGDKPWQPVERWGPYVFFRELSWFAFDLQEQEGRGLFELSGEACVGDGVLWKSYDGMLIRADFVSPTPTVQSRPLSGLSHRPHGSYCGWWRGDLVFVGDTSSTAPEPSAYLWRIDPDTAEVVYQIALIDDASGIVPTRSLQTAEEPLRGRLPRYLPVQSATADGSTLTVVDLERGVVAWRSKPDAQAHAERLTEDLFSLFAGDHLAILDGQTGHLLAAVRTSSVAEIHADDVVDGRLWIHGDTLQPPDRLPWAVLDVRTLRKVAGGNPEQPTVEEDLAGFAQALGIPGAFVGPPSARAR